VDNLIGANAGIYQVRYHNPPPSQVTNPIWKQAGRRNHLELLYPYFLELINLLGECLYN
jgi:hypothetical protein